eukprot:7388685-Prymnesium_polylepis.1
MPRFEALYSRTCCSSERSTGAMIAAYFCRRMRAFSDAGSRVLAATRADSSRSRPTRLPTSACSACSTYARWSSHSSVMRASSAISSRSWSTSDGLCSCPMRDAGPGDQISTASSEGR